MNPPYDNHRVFITLFTQKGKKFYMLLKIHKTFFRGMLAPLVSDEETLSQESKLVRLLLHLNLNFFSPSSLGDYVGAFQAMV